MRSLDWYETEEWVRNAQPGDAAIYFIGNLAEDRGKHREVNRTSAALFRLSRAKGSAVAHFVLCQRRVNGLLRGFEYIVKCVRRPTDSEVKWAFGDFTPYREQGDDSAGNIHNNTTRPYRKRVRKDSASA